MWILSRWPLTHITCPSTLRPPRLESAATGWTAMKPHAQRIVAVRGRICPTDRSPGRCSCSIGGSKFSLIRWIHNSFFLFFAQGGQVKNLRDLMHSILLRWFVYLDLQHSSINHQPRGRMIMRTEKLRTKNCTLHPLQKHCHRHSFLNPAISL